MSNKKKNKSTQVERQDILVPINQVCHTDQVNFILNSASFHAPEEHRRMACLPVTSIEPREIVSGIDEGHEVWNSHRKN
jgi:hypothetical protein